MNVNILHGFELGKVLKKHLYMATVESGRGERLPAGKTHDLAGNVIKNKLVPFEASNVYKGKLFLNNNWIAFCKKKTKKILVSLSLCNFVYLANIN